MNTDWNYLGRVGEQPARPYSISIVMSVFYLQENLSLVFWYCRGAAVSFAPGEVKQDDGLARDRPGESVIDQRCDFVQQPLPFGCL